MRAMRILIPSFPEDVHAWEVALVLREAGHEAVLWHGGDFPTRQAGSVEFGPDGVHWSVHGTGLALDGRPFDVVWHRRAIAPQLPERMHPGDREVAQRECEDFVAGLWNFVSPQAFWVNPPAARARANSKLVQLAQARESGLEIPRTLASNDPARIRAFLDELGGSGIYKAFYPVGWRDGEKLAVLLTSEVRADALPPDDVLRLTPGLFQPRLEKRHELRVTVLGQRLITARLLSQGHAATRLDWRARSVDLEIEPDELPEPVAAGVRDLMRRLGLVFGCIDFIVTPQGRHVFLEVNPMGQFLWIEHGNPRIRLLAPFCEFLLSRGRTDGASARLDVRHADWFERAEAQLAAQAPAHVRWETPYVVSDARVPRAGRSGAGQQPQV
jgi:hypothetical protein